MPDYIDVPFCMDGKAQVIKLKRLKNDRKILKEQYSILLNQSETIINRIMSKYPDVSYDKPLMIRNKNKNKYTFIDRKTQITYEITVNQLRIGFQKIIILAINGKYNKFKSTELSQKESWSNNNIDALVQCTIFGKIKYR